jgi:hypothetical protein
MRRAALLRGKGFLAAGNSSTNLNLKKMQAVTPAFLYGIAF